MSDLHTEKLKFSHRLEGLVRGMGDDFDNIFQDALEGITGKIAILASKAEETESLIRRKQYLTKQKTEIEKVLDEIYKDIGKDIQDKAVELGQATPEIVDTAIKKSLPTKIKIDLGVPRLSKKQVVAWFESSQIEGLFFNDWMQKIEKTAAERIVKETRTSMILRESMRETTKRIQNALNVGRHSAEGIAHNALHGAAVWAEKEYYMENEKQIKALLFQSELDRRTTPLCRSLDGREFPPRDAPTPPLHWRCRSWLYPIFHDVKVEKSLGKRIARVDTEPRTVHHRDGTTSTKYQKLRVKHIPGDMNYNDWMSSMVKSADPRDVAFAKEALGRTRFNLVSSGKLKMESLYYHGKLRTIKQLEELMA